MEGDQMAEFEARNGISIEYNKQYIDELTNERHNLDPSFVHSAKLLDLEISQAHMGQEKTKLLELHNDKPTKVVVKVKVPANEFPRFNFIGKIIGPKGNSLRRIQDETGCRMAVFGRGSMRDKDKEEELRQQGGKYAHLNEELQVYVEAFGHPVDVYRRISHALHELRRHLVPDYNDEVTQQQVQELALLNGSVPPAALRGRGRGGAIRGGSSFPARGGAPSFGYGTSRGSTVGRGFSPRGGPSFRRGGPTSGQVPPLQSQAPVAAAATGYSEYDQEQSGYGSSPATRSFENQMSVNTTGPVAPFSDYNQPHAIQSAFNQQNIQPNFSTQNVQPAAFNPHNATSAPYNAGQPASSYDNPTNIWGAAPANDGGSFGKTPAARMTVGLTRAHPYAPPGGRGGLF